VLVPDRPHDSREASVLSMEEISLQVKRGLLRRCTYGMRQEFSSFCELRDIAAGRPGTANPLVRASGMDINEMATE
jgi:hypothetical protein